MVRKSIGMASKKCAQISKKTGKKVRTKAQRKTCMQRYLSGGKSGKKKAGKKKRCPKGVVKSGPRKGRCKKVRRKKG